MSRSWLSSIPFLLCLLAGPVGAVDIFAGRNVNMVGPPPAGSDEFPDRGLRQQNEPSCAVNPENPLRMCCGFNDYRGIDIPELGDAWEGIACSVDGGQSWNSQLIPGHRADPEFSLGLEFAADPNLVSVPGGLVFNYIAADRDQVGGLYVQLYAWRNKEDGWPVEPVGGPRLVSKGTSGRFIDKPHAFGYIFESGNSVSWSWIGDEGPQSRELPAGRLTVAAAVFTGNENNDGSKINLWTSEDWGLTWNSPTKLSESKGINSGINIAANGDNVCAVWRRFDDNNESNTIFNACSIDGGGKFTKPRKIADVCPFDLTTLNGEAPTPGIVSLRSNAFPVIASDGSRFITLWTDRGYAAASGGPAGCELTVTDPATGEAAFNPSFGRIVYSVGTDNGRNWSTPVPVEDLAGADPSCAVDNPTGFPGHQFMPAVYGAGQEIVAIWFDTRCDQVNQLRNVVDPEVDKQLILDLWNEEQGLWRHTADVRAIRFVDGEPAPTGSTQISQYPRALLDGEIIQGQYDFINARLFLQGTAPFIGDYLHVTAPAYVYDSATEGWKNSNSVTVPGSPVFRAAFGTNRDLFGRLWGGSVGFGEPSPYNPKNGATASGAATASQDTDNSSVGVQDPPAGPLACTPTDNPEINPANDRTRDQNVYMAPIFPEFTLESPGAIKLSGDGAGGSGPLQRALPVQVENQGATVALLQLSIVDQPADGIASFSQFDRAGAAPVTSVRVRVWPGSSAVRTVFVTSPSQAGSTGLRVNACHQSGSCSGVNAVAQVTLNEELLQLEQPDFGNTSILAQETHDPTILNPGLLNDQLIRLLLAEARGDPFGAGPLLQALIVAGYLPDDFQLADVFNAALVGPELLALLLQNPDLLDSSAVDAALLSQLLANPQLLNSRLLDADLSNPDVLNPTLLNRDLLNVELWALVQQNPSLLNPDVLNPDVLNRLVANPDLLNPDLLNLIIANPDVLNPDVLNVLVANQAVFATAVDALDPAQGGLAPAQWSELLNLLVSNPNVLNPDLLNAAVFGGLINVSNDPAFPAGADEATRLGYIATNYAGNPDLVNAVVANPDLLNPNVLNPNVLNPDLLNPDVLNPDVLNPDLLNPDLLNPDLLNPNVLNPNILNPDVLNPDLLNPDVLNPDLLNLLVLNPNVLNPDLLNPNVLNPDLLNPSLLNPDLLNALVENPTLLNPNVLNPDLLNPDLLNVTLDSSASLENPEAAVPDEVDTGSGDYIDVTWQVQNTGNTTTGYTTQTFVADVEGDPALTGAQVLVSKPYLRQTTVNCQQVIETTNNVVVNVPVPITDSFIENPDQTDEANAGLPSFWLAPGEIANVTYRVFGSSAAALADSRLAGRAGLYINSEACSSGLEQSSCAAQLPFALVERDSTPPEFAELDSFYEQFVVPFEAEAPEGLSIEYDLPPALDAGDGGAVPVSCDFAPGDTFPLGMSGHACTATDSSGNQQTITFTVTVLDTAAPEVSVTTGGIGLPRSFEQTSPGGARVDLAELAGIAVVATDNVDLQPEIACEISNGTDVIPVAVDDGGALGGVVELTPGSWDLRCSATDDGPSSSDGGSVGGSNTSDPLTISGLLVVEDTTPPVVIYPDDPAAPPTAEALSDAGAPVIFEVTATDFGLPLPPEAVVCSADGRSVTSGDLFALGSTTVDCTVTDLNAVQASVSFEVVVEDTTGPAVFVPAPGPLVEATGEITVVNFNVQALDAVDGNLATVCTPGSGSAFTVGVTPVNCSAADSAGNSGSAGFEVTVTDLTPPVVAVPAAITVEATSGAGANVDFAATAVDLVDGDVSADVSCSVASEPVVPGDEFPLGTTVVDCSASDARGNVSAPGSFEITVRDTTPPALSLPAVAVIAEAENADGAKVNYAGRVGAADLVDGELPFASIACDRASGSLFPLGVTRVSCAATDRAGNTSEASFFDVEVRDSTDPVLSLTDLGPFEATGTDGAVVEYLGAVSAVDAVDAEVELSCGPPLSGSAFAVGVTVVDCTATDDAGNSSSGSFSVTVRDTVFPVVTVPGAISEEAVAAAGNVISFSATASDLGQALPVSCSPAPGDQFPVGTTAVNCSAVDLSGNLSTAGFTVAVVDTTPPVLSLPSGIELTSTRAAGEVVDYAASAVDVNGVSEPVELNCTPASGSLFPPGETPVVCTASDSRGNNATGNFTVTVNAVPLVWIAPFDDGNPYQGNLDSNINLAWGYGSPADLLDSRSFLDRSGSKGTTPLEMDYLGSFCGAGIALAVDLDAGSSSLRYRDGQWRLNWQTGQSRLVGEDGGESGLLRGCYELRIPRSSGAVDSRLFILN